MVDQMTKIASHRDSRSSRRMQHSRTRDWLLRFARLIAAVIMVLLAAALLGDGISGLTHMS